MHKRLLWGASLAAATMVAAAVVGPDWIEPGEEDAGALTGDAQIPDGEGALITIEGRLDGTPMPAGGGDLEDMYLISIADPVAFFATTEVLPGQTEFDSVLYLFDANGLGLLANEDAGAPGGPAGKVFGACCLEDGTCIEATKVDCQESGGQYQGDFTSCKEVDCETGVTCPGDVNGDGVVDVLDVIAVILAWESDDPDADVNGDGIVDVLDLVQVILSWGACDAGSTIGNESTDGTDVVIDTPDVYFVAISPRSRRPVSASGLIFDIEDLDEVSGPDGPGGEEPIIGWIDVPPPVADVPGAYTIFLGGVEFPPPPALTLPLDIKPGGCPNAFNPGSNGVLPVGLLGQIDFDITQVDITSLSIARADGIGGSATPNEEPPGPHSVFDDVGTPFDGPTCDCHELEGDGIIDLSIKFRTTELVEALELDGLPPGDTIELVVSGTLLDGTPFVGRDCVSLVPPPEPEARMILESKKQDAWIDVTPEDLVGDGGGFADFWRGYDLGAVVTLTAEQFYLSQSFRGWKLNGHWIEKESLSTTLVLSEGNQKLEAVYEPLKLGPNPFDFDLPIPPDKDLAP